MAPPKIITYTDDYVKFGYTFIAKNGVEKPQSVICHVVLTNDVVRPKSPRRQLSTARPMLNEKPKEFFVG